MKELYVEPEHVIVSLIKADQKMYLTIGRLYRFVSYLREQLSEQAALPSGVNIVFNISFDSIERSVRHNDKVFDIIGDMIVIKKDNADSYIRTPENIAEVLTKYAEKFVREFIA